MKNILITGGLGNLGSWLTEYLIRQQYNVDVLSIQQRPILEHLSFNFIQCDISCIDSCRKSLMDKKYDAIIHTASINDNFIDDYFSKSIDINVKGTRNILEVIKDNPPLHFIYISTFQVYGVYEGFITEESPLHTKNDYGNTHLFAEQYVRQFGYSNNLPYSILRVTNGYGCPLDIHSSKWYLILNDLAKTALKNKEIRLNSDGRSKRDFIWLGDICRVIKKLIEFGPINTTANLSSEKAYSLLDIGSFVQKAYFDRYGEKLPIVTNPNNNSIIYSDLKVSSKKLKSIIQYDSQPHFSEEAEKIFNLLASTNTSYQ